MAVGFSTPVSVNCVNGRTSFGIALSGVTSGQPIIVMVAGNGTGASGYTLSDNFSTPYTWTLVVNSTNSSGNICGVAFIGTGGAGTSGTVTVSGISTSNYIGGVGVPLTGASTASGLSAVDTTNISSGSGTSCSVSVTPSASNEGGLAFVSTQNGVTSANSAPWVDTAEYLPVGSFNIGYLSTYPSPASGSALIASWTQSPSAYWCAGALTIKPAVSASPALLSGTVASTSSVVGTLHAPTFLSGTVASVSTVAGSLTAPSLLSGTIVSVSVVSGKLTSVDTAIATVNEVTLATPAFSLVTLASTANSGVTSATVNSSAVTIATTTNKPVTLATVT